MRQYDFQIVCYSKLVNDHHLVDIHQKTRTMSQTHAGTQFKKKKKCK